jgi:hypothetical protein
MNRPIRLATLAPAAAFAACACSDLGRDWFCGALRVAFDPAGHPPV